MSKTTLNDLNDYLFAQLDALGNPDLAGESLAAEIQRAKAITSVAQTIVNNANTIIEANKYVRAKETGDSRAAQKLLSAGDQICSSTRENLVLLFLKTTKALARKN